MESQSLRPVNTILNLISSLRRLNTIQKYGLASEGLSCLGSKLFQTWKKTPTIHQGPLLSRLSQESHYWFLLPVVGLVEGLMPLCKIGQGMR